MNRNDVILAECLEASLQEDLSHLRDGFAADCLKKVFDTESAMQIAHKPGLATTLAKVCYLMADEMMKVRHIEPVKIEINGEWH